MNMRVYSAVVFVQRKMFGTPSRSVLTGSVLFFVLLCVIVFLLCSVFWKARARYEQLGSRLVGGV